MLWCPLAWLGQVYCWFGFALDTFLQLPLPLLPFGWVCNFELIPAPFVLYALYLAIHIYPCPPSDSTPLEWHRRTTAGTAVVLKYCSILRFMRCPSNDASPRSVSFCRAVLLLLLRSLVLVFHEDLLWLHSNYNIAFCAILLALLAALPALHNRRKAHSEIEFKWLFNFPLAADSISCLRLRLHYVFREGGSQRPLQQQQLYQELIPPSPSTASLLVEPCITLLFG